MQWHLNIYGWCFGPIVYSALYQFRTVLELVKWTCVLTWCMWKLFFSSGAGVTDTCVFGTERATLLWHQGEDGVRQQCLCACWQNVHLVLIPRFFFPLALSPQSSRPLKEQAQSVISPGNLPEDPECLNGAQVQARSGAEHWKSCDRSCPSSSRRRDTAVSRSRVEEIFEVRPWIIVPAEIHLKSYLLRKSFI